MVTKFDKNKTYLSDPAISAFDITPSDDADLEKTTRGLYVGVSGDVKVDMSDGETVTFVGLSAGVAHPICAKKIYDTGTSATDIIGLV